MRSFKLLERRARYAVAAIGLVLVGVVAPFASAAQVTVRSIEMSSSVKSATDQTYKIKFTSVGGAGAFVVEFCSNTPLIGQACTKPTGLNLTGAASTTSGFTDVSVIDDADDNTLVVAGTIGATTAISVDVSSIDNPSTAGPMYARIVTYDTDAHADAYQSATLGTGVVDEGSVALSITDGIGVTGDVLESMAFCVSKTVDITAGCGGSLDAPTLEIGELNGSVRSLSSSALSTVDVLTQISTNAVGGAVVSLKSNTTGCGGLSRLGAASFAAGCGIAAAGSTGTFAAGTAKIGVKGATATDEGTGAGTYQVASGYDTSEYRLNYVAGDGTGVTSAYGDPILNTASAPASNKEMTLTFGASISPSTPAGRYTANYSLIATGTF